jgi:hypothetical protein
MSVMAVPMRRIRFIIIDKRLTDSRRQDHRNEGSAEITINFESALEKVP